MLLLLLVAAAAFVAGLVVSGGESASPPAPPEGAAEVRCDEVLVASDDAVQFVAGLRAGETGCLRGGVHEVDGVATIEAPEVVLTGYPGETATLAGRLWIKREADGARVENLVLDGRNPDANPSPTVNADDVVLRGNDISNDHTAICVSVNEYAGEPPSGVVIENNVIHDCGELPATNHHHGIYVANALGTVVRDNLIYGNADRGVQLYPNADGSSVTGNIIEGNGQGVIFGGGPSSSSDDNLVADNVISNSTIRWNVQSHWQGPVGSGNVARDNCVWMTGTDYSGSPPGSGIEPGIDGAQAFDNVVADPGFADPAAGDLRIDGDSPCASLGAPAG